MTGLITMTFRCRKVTVITGFSDLEEPGWASYMNLNGGGASIVEPDQLDGEETALRRTSDRRKRLQALQSNVFKKALKSFRPDGLYRQ